MRRDFTMRLYNEFLESALRAGYELTTFQCYIENAEVFDRVIILRHDVDKKPANALKMAEIERDMGLSATYYFRIVEQSFDPEVIKKIANCGHEIGYHYEDLSLAAGNVSKAVEMFASNLETLRCVNPIKTICMHGSPMSRWDNRLIFNYIDYRDYGIVAEPYLDTNFDAIYYMTDTGRTWNNKKIGIRDKVKSGFNITFVGTREIIDAMYTGAFPKQAMINTHPQRWNDNMIPWGLEYVTQNCKNLIKGVVVRRDQ